MLVTRIQFVALYIYMLLLFNMSLTICFSYNGYHIYNRNFNKNNFSLIDQHFTNILKNYGTNIHKNYLLKF